MYPVVFNTVLYVFTVVFITVLYEYPDPVVQSLTWVLYETWANVAQKQNVRRGVVNRTNSVLGLPTVRHAPLGIHVQLPANITACRYVFLQSANACAERCLHISFERIGMMFKFHDTCMPGCRRALLAAAQALDSCGLSHVSSPPHTT